MTYTTSSRWLDPPQAIITAPMLQAWFESRGRALAPEFGEGADPARKIPGRYTPPPAGLGASLIRACQKWAPVVPDIIAAAGQVDVETAGWQSYLARVRLNPGGIGAEDDDPLGKALAFPNLDAALDAFVAHILTYAVGRGAWNATDPRFSNVPARNIGTRQTLGSFAGAWATNTQYGTLVAARANNLLAFALAWNEPEQPMPTLAPPAGWQPPEIVRHILPWGASNTPGQKLRGGSWDYLTTHNTGNPNPTANALMHASYLEGLAKAGADEPSWHYTIDDTRIVQHLEDDWAGWHASDGTGDGNFDSLGFELVEIGDQERVLWNAGWLMAGKLKARGKTIAEAMRQHHDWARDGKDCPRLLRANGGAGWKRLLAIIGYFLNDAPAPPSDNWPKVPVTERDPWRADNPWGKDKWIPRVFVVEIRAAPWHLTGYALTEAFAESGADGAVRVVQYFERARLELNQDGAITRGLLGYEALVARHPERKPA